MKTIKLKIAPTALLCVAVVLGVTGCGKPGGGGEATNVPMVGSKGQTSNSSTVQAIEALIKSETTLQGASITVKETSGSISLEGTVKNQAQKDKAESIVTTIQKEKGQQTGVLDNLMIEETK
jgi:osmotically-inducible protein OsmY